MEQLNGDVTRIGSMTPLDLSMLAEFVGMEDLPFPFWGPYGQTFRSVDEYRAHRDSVINSYRSSPESKCVNRWFTSYRHADIWVECKPLSLPMIAHRQGQTGYLAVQRVDDLVIDVFAISPYHLGSAIAATARLTKPGRKDRIVLPGMPIPSLVETPMVDSDNFAISHRVTSPLASVLTESHWVSTVQSRHQPTRERGFDLLRPWLKWVSVEDDGDYIAEPEGKFFTPMSRQTLARRIDALIAADVKAVRAARGLD